MGLQRFSVLGFRVDHLGLLGVLGLGLTVSGFGILGFRAQGGASLRWIKRPKPETFCTHSTSVGCRRGDFKVLEDESSFISDS